jgi:hypothetical protein
MISWDRKLQLLRLKIRFDIDSKFQMMKEFDLYKETGNLILSNEITIEDVLLTGIYGGRITLEESLYILSLK